MEKHRPEPCSVVYRLNKYYPEPGFAGDLCSTPLNDLCCPTNDRTGDLCSTRFLCCPTNDRTNALCTTNDVHSGTISHSTATSHDLCCSTASCYVYRTGSARHDVWYTTTCDGLCRICSRATRCRRATYQPRGARSVWLLGGGPLCYGRTEI